VGKINAGKKAEGKSLVTQKTLDGVYNLCALACCGAHRQKTPRIRQFQGSFHRRSEIGLEWFPRNEEPLPFQNPAERKFRHPVRGIPCLAALALVASEYTPPALRR